MIKLKRIILASSILSLVLIYTYNKYAKETKGIIKEIPSFHLEDINGKSISPENFIGRKIYIQFLDADVEYQLRLLINVITKYKSNDTVSIIIVNNLEKLKRNAFINIIRRECLIINGNIKKYKKIFNSPSCCEMYYLFDNNGKLLFSNFNWNKLENVELDFNRTRKETAFSIFSLFNIDNYIYDNKFGRKLYEYIIKNNNSEWHLIGIFSSICMSCLSGSIIDELIEIEKNCKQISITTLLTDDFTDRDVINVKANLKLNFNVVKARSNIADEIIYLKNKYGKSNINNLIIVTNNEGKILSLYDQNCIRCKKSFFSDIRGKICKK